MHKKQILVVEDNKLNREILCEILSGEYQVLEADNGQAALELLERDKSSVSLIFLDVVMPVMDGYAFLDRIRSDAELSGIPVVVTTQNGGEDDEVTALSHGATDFVPKPYRPQVILHRAASLIKLRESAAMVNQFMFDRLTGLYSKEYFYRRVREFLLENPATEYNIICSNIENFKVYNDTFGMKSGDRLLQTIAEQMRQQVGVGGLYARFGADRFLFLKRREEEEQDRAKMEAFAHGPFGTKNLVVKWGIYEITDRSVPVEQMVDRAFLAADSIKGKYNQCIAVYDDVLRNKLLREQSITESMESALSQGQFTVYLQPKYSLHDDQLSGAEALVRWIHPQWGFMSPGEFIPLFEKNGFITQLDRYVWEQVCILLRDWRRKGYPMIAVSVNVSRADVYQDDLQETLSGLVKKYGIEPQQLHLELTESAYTENPSQIIATVDRLREVGFIVEMDDFGSGYSSLNMLNQMKLDILKLDMKFIQTETAKPAEQGIIRFVINLARWLNLSVVAEGVETRAQLERLREVGCDYVQGYLFSKPLPAETFEALLVEQLSNPREPEPFQRKEPDLKTLLVVDPDSVYRGRVCRAFEGMYHVLEAADAQSAFACVQERGRNQVVAVILSMDLPDGGAAAFLSALRSDPELWRIPVLSSLPVEMVSDEIVQQLDTDDFLCKNHPICDLRRRANRMIGLNDYKKKAQVLESEVCRDFLTGLLNRRGLDAAMDALRHEDLPAAVYVFDLDNLKQINDRSGHEAGDAVVCAFADVLRRNTRSTDILCRYGGDEFVAILRHINSPEIVMKKGEAICRDFRAAPLPDGVQATCSGGIVLCDSEEMPSSTSIDRADAALYQAKRENKGGCCMWKEGT
ncbi:MAG: EAL domain-containing protein [Faecousia sp.]